MSELLKNIILKNYDAKFAPNIMQIGALKVLTQMFS